MVMPVQTVSAGEETKILAIGLGGEIADALTRIGGVRVISRLQRAYGDGEAIDYRRIAEEFQVDYALSMALTVASGQVRVRAELHRLPAGFVDWSESFQEPLSEFFTVKRGITEAVATALGGEPFRSEYLRIRERPTDSLDAWALTQHSANLVLSMENFPNWDRANALARRAIALDAEFGTAQARLAALLAERAAFLLSVDSVKDVREALDAAETAARLAPYDPYVLMNCGQAWNLCDAVARGRRAVDQAVQQLPYDSLAWLFYCFARVYTGDHSDLQNVITICDRVSTQSRGNPVGRHFTVVNMLARFCLKQYEFIVQQHMKSCLGPPLKSVTLWPIVAAANAELGDTFRAKQVFEAVLGTGLLPSPADIAPTFLRLAGNNAAIAGEFTRGLTKAGIIP